MNKDFTNELKSRVDNLRSILNELIDNGYLINEEDVSEIRKIGNLITEYEKTIGK